LRQLETAANTDFDKHSLELLREVLRDPDKRSLFVRLAHPLITYEGFGSGVIRATATTAVGVAGAFAGAKGAAFYVAEKTREYLADHISPFNEAVKSVVLELMNVIPDLRRAEVGLDMAKETVVGTVTDAGRSVRHGGELIYGWAKQKITGEAISVTSLPKTGGAPISATALESLLDGVQESASSARGLGEALSTSAIDLASSVASVPGAISGWATGSGLAGGALEVAKEMNRATGFGRLQEFIKSSDAQVLENRPPLAGEDDPRFALLALEERLRAPDRAQFALSNKEWVLFCAAVHRARASLLRERTRAPTIAMNKELRTAGERQTELVERIIDANVGQEAIDRELAASLLSQFDSGLDRETAHYHERFATMNSTREKIDRYGRAFVRGGIRATGLPLLCGVASTAVGVTARVGGQVVSAVINPIGKAFGVITAPVRIISSNLPKLWSTTSSKSSLPK